VVPISEERLLILLIEVLLISKGTLLILLIQVLYRNTISLALQTFPKS
jgi:hypothetical protein